MQRTPAQKQATRLRLVEKCNVRGASLRVAIAKFWDCHATLAMT